MTLDRNYRIGTVDRRLYGSFLEHVGRAIYTGIYEPGHPTADADGFRADVLKTVRELDVPIVRYPGGNFVSGYDWKDGIGPKGTRPKRLELAARIIEPNEIGTDEFMKWAGKAGTDVMMTVNLGTQGIANARDLVEYCNFAGGTEWSDRRIGNGSLKPYGIRNWCLGNEMDGPWQLGQKTAAEYGLLAAQAGKAMKRVDPAIELTVCGSAVPSLDTYPAWDREVLELTYDFADYICLHSYYGNQSGDTPAFLARNVAMDEYIRTMEGVCDYVRARRRGRKQIWLSFDEWNVWYHSNEADRHIANWTVAPAQSEEDYTLLDALLFGSCFITLLNHCDRVKMACVAQLVNVLAPIIALPGGGCYRHTTYYPWLHVSRYGRGTALTLSVDSPLYDCADYERVPFVDAAAVLSDTERELTLFVVNKNLESDLPLALKLNDLEGYRVTGHTVLESPSVNDGNTPEQPERVIPRENGNASVADNVVTATLRKASWNVIRLKRGE